MNRADDLTPYGRMARVFQIFDGYDDGTDQSVNAQHDEIWAGPNPAKVRPEHIEELADLGWQPAPEYDTFHRFT